MAPAIWIGIMRPSDERCDDSRDEIDSLEWLLVRNLEAPLIPLIPVLARKSASKSSLAFPLGTCRCQAHVGQQVVPMIRSLS